MDHGTTRQSRRNLLRLVSGGRGAGALRRRATRCGYGRGASGGRIAHRHRGPGGFLASSCRSGGATRGGNASCGGFTGAGRVIGHLCDRPRGKFADRSAGRRVSVLAACKGVREKAGKNCPEVVAEAAAWTAEALLKQFSA